MHGVTTKITVFIKIFFEQALSSLEGDRVRSVECINLSQNTEDLQSLVRSVNDDLV